MENLRRELHPDLPHLAAHLTLLPPRILHGTEISALHLPERICSEAQPFEVALGDVETFTPGDSHGLPSGESGVRKIFVQRNMPRKRGDVAATARGPHHHPWNAFAINSCSAFGMFSRVASSRQPTTALRTCVTTSAASRTFNP